MHLKGKDLATGQICSINIYFLDTITAHRFECGRTSHLHCTCEGRYSPTHPEKRSPPAQPRCIYVDATWIYVFTWTDFCQRKIHVDAT